MMLLNEVFFSKTIDMNKIFNYAMSVLIPHGNIQMAAFFLFYAIYV